MKIKHRFLLSVLIAGLGLIPAGPVSAQIFTTLHNFTAFSNFTNSDGANPYAGLILSGNTLYGTAENGGSSGLGTVFAVHTDGTGFTNLHAFRRGGYNDSSVYTNSDGIYPSAGLVLSNNTLYGTAKRGGDSGNGTVFAVHTDGTGFTTLHNFHALFGLYETNSDGAFPESGLVLSGNTLYGTANQGGVENDNGTMFAVQTDGTGFTNLHSFKYIDDGAHPQAGLILSGNTLYGTTSVGGIWDSGTVFAVQTDGTGFTKLYTFTLLSNYTNSDGSHPFSGLILSSNTLYGTATQGGDLGGDLGGGTVFAVNTDGTGFTNLHSFSNGSGGANPSAGLILSGNTLYGAAVVGGTNGNGTVFGVKTDGSGFMTLHSFTFVNYDSSNILTNGDGTSPQAGLVLSGNTLFGTASAGGSSDNGTVFALHLVDTTPPNVALDSISDDQVITNTFLPGVFGTATDPETGISFVDVWIERATNSGFVYWNGSGWQANDIWSTATYNVTNGTWIVNIPLPSGGDLFNADYVIEVLSANNESSSETVNQSFQFIHFSVDYHPVFVFTYGSQFGQTPNNNWSDPANWDVGSIPTPDARVVINGFLPDNTSLGSNHLYRLDMSGGTLTTSNMLITNLNLSGGTLSAGAISLPANGVFNWSGGTILGSYNVPAGATLNLSGPSDKTMGVFGAPAIITNNGRVTWNGGNLLASYASVIDNNATFVLQSSCLFYNYTGATPSPTFNNNGLLQKTNSNGEAAFTPDIGGWILNQNGTIDIENGALSLQSHVNVNGGASFAGPGVTRIDAGVIFINGTNTIQPGATLELAGGTWNGTNVFIGSGAFVWSGGAISLANLSLQSNTAFNLSGANLKTLGDFNGPCVISSAGPGTWTGAGIVNVAVDSSIVNSGTFTVLNDSAFVNYSGATPVPVFVNNGTFVKTNSSGTNTTFFGADPKGGMAFNNNGIVDVRSGNLVLGGGGTSANDSFAVAAGSVIDFRGGSFLFNGNLALLGAGTNRVSGATVAFNNGTNSIGSANTFEIASGLVNGTSTFAGAGTFNWSGGAISSANLSLQSNVVFNLTGANVKTLGDFNGPGVISSAGPGTWTGTGIVNVGVTSVINNNGTFTVLNDSSFVNYTGTLPLPVFVNNGSFIKTNSSGTNTTFFGADPDGGMAFNNNGSVNVQSGMISLGGGGAGTSGAFTVASGSHIDFVSGVFSVAGSPSFSGAGSTRVNGGTLTFENSMSTMTAGGTFEVASGNLHGTNTFAGTGAFVWSGGLISKASISLQTNVAFNLAGSNIKTLGDFSGPSVINSAGPGLWTGAGVVNAGVGSIISNSGSFTVQNDSSFINYTGSLPPPVFVNTGTFRKNTTTGSTLFAPDNGGVNFNNSGTLDLQTGTLAINGGFSLSGSPQLHLALGGPSPGTQFGQETFANSTTLGGALTVTLTNGFSPTNGQSFPLVAYASESGQFTSQQLPVLPINLAWQVTYGATALTLNVVPASGTIIADVTRLVNGHIQFSVSGPTGTSAIVQAFTNLLDWTFLQTNAPFTGSMLFEDAQATGYPARFYRVLVQP